MDQDKKKNLLMKLELIIRYLDMQEEYNGLISRQEDLLTIKKKEKIKQLNLRVCCLKLGIEEKDILNI